ncbi:MAG TPA: NAD(P)H:quinone oxidoreductase [Deinococcales bacterium]|nr:NAD(P)H:quinone oxidoreductase [Deinococcales bacterium]
MAKVAIIYYSSYGNTYQLAKAVEEGARATGSETRLRKVRELAPDEVIATQAGWHAHRQATQHVQEATLADLEWADGIILGAPTRYGGPAAQMKQFIDTTGPLWARGGLANKAVSGFTGAQNPHGGQEATLLSLYNAFYHWGSIIVPVGYTDPVIYQAGGNPYGVSFTQPKEGDLPDAVLAAGRYLGGRVARYAEVLASNQARLLPRPEQAARGAEAAGGEPRPIRE